MKRMFTRLSYFVAIMAAVMMAGCCDKASFVGQKTDALDAAAWQASKWISAVDAPILEKWNHDRAADGASWFVSTVKNEGKVISAKWMTAGL